MRNNQFFPFIFFENKFVEHSKAKISIMTNALQYGTAIFGGIRGYYNHERKFLSIFRIDDHYKRFLQALKILGVSFDFGFEQLKEITLTLIKKNKPKTDIYLRPFAYAANLYISPTFYPNESFAFALYMIPLGDYLPTDKGLSVCVSSFRRISDNAIPARAKISGAYVNSALARFEAQKNGFDEAIFLTEDGHVSEGSAENIFIVRDKTLITPAKTEEILEGVTRKTIIKLAADLGIAVEERRIDRSELYVADEVFFAGTGVKIAWIGQIDKRIIGDGKRGEITAKIQDLYFEVVKGNQPKYDHWCTKLTF